MERKKTSPSKKNGGRPDTALLLIDVISDFEFEDGAELFAHALPVARNIKRLKTKAGKAGLPIIYINDNFGMWRDDFQKTLKNCLKKTARGYEIVNLLKPEKDDYFVLKPKHSAFYSTTLDLLLDELKIKKVILAGISTDICVLFSANDAYMRGYEVIVPQDCAASVKPEENERAFKYIERVAKADISPSNEIDFSKLVKKAE